MITNCMEVMKKHNIQYHLVCPNCFANLVIGVVSFQGNFYICNNCGYSDYDKTIQPHRVKNKELKLAPNYIVGKLYGGGGYVYEDGIKVRDITYEEFEAEYLYNPKFFNTNNPTNYDPNAKDNQLLNEPEEEIAVMVDN